MSHIEVRPKVSVFIATSLDGYISKEDGNVDWLDTAHKAAPPGEDFGYAEFMKTIDTIVMGRNTFEKVLTFDSWLYTGKHVVVLSRSMTEVPKNLDAVSVTQEQPKALLKRLHAENVRHVYVDGGITIQNFLAEGLIDDMIISTLPVLLGRGRPLFGTNSRGMTQLKLQYTKSFGGALTQSKYSFE